MKNDNAVTLGGVGIVLLIAFLALLLIVAIIVPFVTQDYVTLTITGKDTYTTTDCSSDSDGHTSCSTIVHKLLYTNGEILEMSDTLVLLNLGSQTAYSHIQLNKTYRFKVYGYSYPALNMYRTIINTTEVEV